ncbi:MAG TPA: universal stress protein [Solirubrobacteraceae bacterium]|jgi:nucleotide-binding universal stress UspA family protein|nr:universal stress protein [Solirubrobacteraceae bacterium]
MSTKIIVSYDGTNNEDDAIALGRILARAGGEVALAYVRHTHEPESEREALAQNEAETLLERGAALLGLGDVQRHVVSDRSTPEGLRALAERTGASLIVFCSDSHTAKGHIGVGNSAQRLLENGPVGVAVAPAGLAQRSDSHLQRIAFTDDPTDTSAKDAAASLAAALSATVVSAQEPAEMLVVGSRPEAEPGRVSVSAASMRLIEDAAWSVIVLPRGVKLTFAVPVALSA